MGLYNQRYYQQKSNIDSCTVKNLEQKWNTPLVAFPIQALVINNDIIFVCDELVSGNGQPQVLALDVKTGNVLWTTILEEIEDFVYQDIVLDKTNVYVVTFAGFLYALRQSDGSVIWGPIEAPFTSPYEGFYASPTVVEKDNLLLFSTGNFPNLPPAQGHVFAYDTTNGNLVWTFTNTGNTSSSAGTISTDGVTNNVVGTGTNFTASMVGGWIVAYDPIGIAILGESQITSVTDATDLITLNVLPALT
jgi:outer membrane protein assembly factor BamB